MRKLAAWALALLLSGCAGTVGLLGNPQLPGTVSTAASGFFGIPAATVSSQMSAEISQIQALASQLQMLKAQLDGTPVSLPTLPVAPVSPAPPVTVPMTPVVVNPAPIPTPTPLPTVP